MPTPRVGGVIGSTSPPVQEAGAQLNCCQAGKVSRILLPDARNASRFSGDFTPGEELAKRASNQSPAAGRRV